jgi:uncharacterized Zn finger protein (UPF0148 family)
MTAEQCPNCGAPLPAAAGQHAVVPTAGVVTCPTCGATVSLHKPGADPEAAAAPPAAAPATGPEAATPPADGAETFSGEETVEGVLDELRDKEGGPR